MDNVMTQLDAAMAELHAPEPEPVKWPMLGLATVGFAAAAALVPIAVSKQWPDSNEAHIGAMAAMGGLAYLVGVYAAKTKYV